MKDLKLFTTEHGAASLILREIPYRGEAYIRIQASQEPEALLEECVAFCRSAGAGRVYAAGHAVVEAYRLHTAIWRMKRSKEGLPDAEDALFPVQESTLEHWRDIYNRRMAPVPNAAWMTQSRAEEMLKKGDGYFVHSHGTLLGLGRASGNRLDAVVSCVPGAGERVALALSHAILDEEIILEVASANARAVRLYQRMGFILSAELSRWYEIC